ncbi:hypothetical protein DFH06DRAFT_1362955 [Mycena polygramma]|nr:hypothetical protein DFH06DRAFT_1362955 [Mycena polygramma]
MVPALFLVAFAGLGSALTLSARDGTPLANVYTNCTVPGTVAFTFDDGPYKSGSVDLILPVDVDEMLTWNSNQRKNISDMFTSAGGHCTFFVNGNNCETNRGPAFTIMRTTSSMYTVKVIRLLPTLGRTRTSRRSAKIRVDTHSLCKLWPHSLCAADSEILKVDEKTVALQNILGVTPACLRPPYGSYNDTVRAAAASHNKSLIIWDLVSGDSTGASPAESEKTYEENKFSATLPLNHETCNTTV